LEEQVVELEEVIFGEKFIQETTGRIYRLKRASFDQAGRLSTRGRVQPPQWLDLELVPEDTKPYFRDVYDHAVRINEMVDTASCSPPPLMRIYHYLGVAEQRHQASCGVGRHHRRTYGDS
jgi:Mg2+ and Co2+ transporter CorA